MAITAYDGIAPIWYVPDSEDENAEDAAAFLLHPLTGPQLLDVQQHFNLEDSTVRGPGLVMACNYGMRGWRHIIDKSGKDMKFSSVQMRKLPAEYLAECGGKIISMSVMDEDEAGNS